ncbi:hypothetical protein AYL99_00430 [Fonsecaea erecta]|uniref:Uncharacterized protein n=1 Tax=Fonsecaea erecta TaxID=1367422 RepID=A0A178ZX96_9EURO|nr:hypothetical protein AYL99_00430 [Fonsecaea erecta]OAP64458.1 hypothetical protein AYL99_00430 [Fonsecaea erecta]
MMRWHLERNDWNVNRSASEFWWCEDRPTEAPAGRPRPQGLRTEATVERERLKQVHDMQTALRRNFPNWRVENVPMMLLYRDNNFVQDRAQEAITSRAGDYDDYEEEAARLSGPPDGQLDMDQRLALFLNISATNSVYSARQLLQKHHWDVGAAIEAWMEAGGVRVTFPPDNPADQGGNYGLRDVNVNRPPRIRDGQFQFFDDDYIKLLSFVSKKRKAPENGADGDPSDPSSSDPSSSDLKSVISGGHSGEPDPELGAPSSIARKRRKTAASEMESDVASGSAPGPELDESEESDDDGQRYRGFVAGRDYIRGNRGGTGNPRGALVNPSRDPAVVHCPDPTKLYIEYIKEGKYKCMRFKGQAKGRRDMRFRWEDDKPDDDDTLEEVEFDWHNKAHIVLLNRWRNDRHVQITGVTKGDLNGGPFNKYEEQWLVEQEAMRIEEKFCARAGQAPGQNVGRSDPAQYQVAEAEYDRGTNFPVPLSAAELQDLTNRFNATFMNRRYYNKVNWMPDPNNQFKFIPTAVLKDMALVGPVPRPQRSINEIKQHRCRIAAYSKHYMLRHDKAKWKNVQDESELVSDIDSDFEDVSGRRAPLPVLPAAATNAGGGSGTQAQTGTEAAQNANAGPSTASSGAGQNANDSLLISDDNMDLLDDDDDVVEDEDMYGPG